MKYVSVTTLALFLALPTQALAQSSPSPTPSPTRSGGSSADDGQRAFREQMARQMAERAQNSANRIANETNKNIADNNIPYKFRSNAAQEEAFHVADIFLSVR